MFGRFFNGFKASASKVFDLVKTPLRKLGSFVLQNHQPISALTNALTSQSENPYVKAIGSGAVLGSALLSQRGVGTNYFNVPQPQMSGG
jgi:hypothetical protein